MITIFGSDSIFLGVTLLSLLIIFSLLFYLTIKVFHTNNFYLSNFYYVIIVIILLMNWIFIIKGFVYSLVYIKNLIFLSIGLMYFILNFIITDKLSYTNFKSRTKERTIETLVLTSWIVGLIFLILSSIKY